jgi:manganese/zinc/iron transport system substrate-binding protein
MLIALLLGSTAIAAEQPVRVVATVGMVADIVRESGGDAFEVTSLVGEGIDPHLYKPTRHDVLALTRADIIFYNGLMLEGKMADTLDKLSRQKKPVIALADMFASGEAMPGGASGHQDPHVWMDVSLWSKATERAAEALIAHQPALADDILVRTALYRERLAQLHAYISEIMATIPEERRLLITAHDAFNYFGRAYGIEVMGIQGFSTESEAGLNDINRLVDVLVDRKISAIFVETSVADRNVKALIEGARSRGHEVIIGGSLYSDAMGAAGTYEGTYIGMLDHNASTIARALGGQVPENGFAGWKGTAP